MTASASPSATSSATASASPTATVTALPSVTASPTTVPRPLYLPILLHEALCEPGRFPADVVLVLDASSSMTGAKFAAAQAAALTFVDAMNLPLDHIAVVAFSENARLASTLSGDRAALAAAVQGLRTSPGTRIDRGLALARQALADPGRPTDRRTAVVLLTDGRQTELPGSSGTEASALRADGVALFTIGLGADADTAMLLALVGDPARYFFAPTPDDLAAIYRTIAAIIPCRPGWPMPLRNNSR